MTTTGGSVVHQARFLPFGGSRGWGSAPTTAWLDRGYTGHLHNDGVGLIYMNARYYVPSLGRFASADTRIPDFANPQAFNRYTYTVNNPIRLIDPSGHLFWDIVDVAFFAKSAYDFYHEPSWANAGWLALDTVSLAPVVPSLGWIKYGDDVVEGAARVVNQVSNAGQVANKAIDAAQSVDGYRSFRGNGIHSSSTGKAFSDWFKVNILRNPSASGGQILSGRRVADIIDDAGSLVDDGSRQIYELKNYTSQTSIGQRFWDQAHDYVKYGKSDDYAINYVFGQKISDNIARQLNDMGISVWYIDDAGEMIRWVTP